MGISVDRLNKAGIKRNHKKIVDALTDIITREKAMEYGIDDAIDVRNDSTYRITRTDCILIQQRQV